MAMYVLMRAARTGLLRLLRSLLIVKFLGIMLSIIFIRFGWQNGYEFGRLLSRAVLYAFRRITAVGFKGK